MLYIRRCSHQLIRPSWNLCLTSANHLLLAINASINFLIYCSIGKKFKAVLKRIFLRKDKDMTRYTEQEFSIVRFLNFYLSSRFELSSKNSSQKDPNSHLLVSNVKNIPSPSIQTIGTVTASPDGSIVLVQTPRTDTAILKVETEVAFPDISFTVNQTESASLDRTVCLDRSVCLDANILRTRNVVSDQDSGSNVTKF